MKESCGNDIDPGRLPQFLEHRIADRRFLYLIRRWLGAGVSEDGRWTKTAVGKPQGGGGRAIIVASGP